MTEWTACWRVPMGRMSKMLHIPVRSGMTPQQAAKKLAKRAVFLLYETTPETPGRRRRVPQRHPLALLPPVRVSTAG